MPAGVDDNPDEALAAVDEVIRLIRRVVAMSPGALSGRGLASLPVMLGVNDHASYEQT
jgi:hypothetical protein